MASKIRTIIVVGSLAVLVGGCGWEKVKTMKEVQPSGTKFDTALYKGYVKLGDTEAKEVDWGNAVTFAERAIAAASAKPGLPEELARRDLPKDKVGELTAARGRLVKALDRGARDKIPDQAAHAQVMFDCWMEEQEENHQPKDIKRCRAGFEEAMAKVDKALKPKPKAKRKPAPKPAPKVAAKPAPKPVPLPGPYTVFFDFDSAKLTGEAQAIITSAASGAKKAKPKQIVLSGHADRAGPGSYNVKLSQSRADAVASALIEAGVSPELINKAVFGEEQPRVATPDGKPERMNRRVEIVFKR